MARILIVVMEDDGNDSKQTVVSFNSNDQAIQAFTELEGIAHSLSLKMAVPEETK